MVDYTKAEMRDESWRRWKGGAKLSEQLRNFYTNKRVFDRLAADAARLGTASPSTANDPAPNLGRKGRSWNAWNADYRIAGGRRSQLFAARLRSQYGSTSNDARSIAKAAAQSGADLSK